MNRLEDRRVLVTGGTTGIGEAIVGRCVDEGARVAFCARSQDTGAAVAASTGAAFYACDVTDAERVEDLMERVAADLGGIDLLVANVGGALGYSQWPDEGPDEWQSTVDLNLNGTMFTCRAAWRHLQRGSSPAIVIISSLSAVMAIGPDQVDKMGGIEPPASYQASKAAIDGLMIHLAGRGAADGIRVNSIRPGRILTDKYLEMFQGKAEEALFWNHYRELQLIKRHGRVEDVANAVVFLGSDESSFITGQILNVDGGAIAHL